MEERLGLDRRLLGVADTRAVTKLDMPNNDALPEIRVDPETFDVFADGVLATCAPARTVPLARRYMLR